jgi:uncharacterized membrane protein
MNSPRISTERISPVPRDATLDVLRGLAILAMVVGHLVVAVGDIPCFKPLLVAGGLAPVLFVFISGYLVSYLRENRQYGLGYFLIRGILLIFIGTLVDVFIWQIIPFFTVDILYFIGLSLPLVYLLSYLSIPVRMGLLLIIILGTPLLQHGLGYAPYPTELYLNGTPTVETTYTYAIWKHYFVDGWFPLFPWLGVSLAGMLFYWLRTRRKELFRQWLAGGSAVLIVGGLLLWWPIPSGLPLRLQYGGIFMPPGPGYLMTSLGLVAGLFWLLQRIVLYGFFNLIGEIGKSSLLFYILHLTLIKYLIPYLGNPSTALAVLKLFGVVAGILTIIGWGVKQLKARMGRLPLVLRILLGG